MSRIFSILIYGRDPQLLNTRRLLLEKSGHQVRVTMDINQVDRVADLMAVDLLIFCHSLSPEQCDQALVFAHARWPKVKVLVLTAGLAGCSDALSDKVLDAMQGPAKLISTVSQLVPLEATAQTHVHQGRDPAS